MNTDAVIIIGAGRIGRRIAKDLTAKGKSVLLVKLPGQPEDALLRHLKSLHGAGLAPEEPLPPGVEVREGLPAFIAPRAIRLNGETLEAKKFVLAMGAVPRVPSLPENARQRLKFPADIDFANPKFSTALILGGGPSGVAAALKLRDKGVNTSLVYSGPRLLSRWEPELSHFFTDALLKRAIPIKQRSEGMDFNADVIIGCEGFIPNSHGLKLKEAGVFVKADGGVAVDEEMRTSQPGHWAAGTVTGDPYSLSLEDRQASIAAHNLTAPSYDRWKMETEPVPLAYPLNPPAATIGLTEAEARRKFKDVITVSHGNFSSGREGFIKIVARSKTGEILGAQLAAPGAEELITFIGLGIRCGATVEELALEQFAPELTVGAEFIAALKKLV